MNTMNIIVFLLLFTSWVSSESCNVRNFDNGPVCVCNSSYCDTIPALNDLKSDQYQLYYSSESNLGFNTETGEFVKNVKKAKNENSHIRIDLTEQLYEPPTPTTIIGFGGAFTDSTGINIDSLPELAQEKLLESYFGETGVGYNLCRVPVGGTDFSTRPYSYDDVVNDTTLEHFELQPEDLNYKIPYIKKALELRNNDIKLFASAWSSPIWMKTNNAWSGKGIALLKEEFFQLWADYYIKFFEKYDQEGIQFWGMTTGNEPVDGFLPTDLNSLGWIPTTMNKWIGDNLGPTIRNSSFKDLKIILHDEQRFYLPLLPLLLGNKKTLEYADGVAVHFYYDSFTPVSFLNFAKSPKKDLFLLGTEACTGYLNAFGLEQAVSLGNWSRAEQYIKDIFEDLENGASGWLDWNMVLDLDGGPCYINNSVDSPIIVNPTAGEFYKQPMYYALGHFSKFILPGSYLIPVKLTIPDTCKEGDLIKVIGFKRPDKWVAIIVSNSGNLDYDLDIGNSDRGHATIQIRAKSISTILFPNL